MPEPMSHYINYYQDHFFQKVHKIMWIPTLNTVQFTKLVVTKSLRHGIGYQARKFGSECNILCVYAIEEG